MAFFCFPPLVSFLKRHLKTHGDMVACLLIWLSHRIMYNGENGE